MMDKEPETGSKNYAVPLFLSGAVIGAVLGVLLAPDSGKETRRKLSTWLKEKQAKGKDEFAAVKHALAAGKEAYQKDERKHAVAH